MRASPYRESSTLSRPIAPWDARRATDLGFKVVAVCGVGAVLAVGVPHVRALHVGARARGPGLSRDQIAAVVRAHAAETVTCLVRASDSKADAAMAPVTVYATVNGTGRVTGAMTDGTSVGNCLEGKVSSWAFPATGTTTRAVPLPFKYVDR